MTLNMISIFPFLTPLNSPLQICIVIVKRFEPYVLSEPHFLICEMRSVEGDPTCRKLSEVAIITLVFPVRNSPR